jgi:hypothetical protein
MNPRINSFIHSKISEKKLLRQLVNAIWRTPLSGFRPEDTAGGREAYHSRRAVDLYHFEAWFNPSILLGITGTVSRRNGDHKKVVYILGWMGYSKDMTDYLFAKPSVLEGIGRNIDLFGMMNTYNSSKSGAEADMKAILNDWAAVYGDLYRAYGGMICQVETKKNAG